MWVQREKEKELRSSLKTCQKTVYSRIIIFLTSTFQHEMKRKETTLHSRHFSRIHDFINLNIVIKSYRLVMAKFTKIQIKH